MAPRTLFHLIADIQSRTGVKGLLVGGFAVNCYQVSRQTADVDLLVVREDFEKMLPRFLAEGYRLEENREIFARLRKTTGPWMMDLDFLFAAPPVVERLFQEGKDTQIAGQTFRVPSLLHLIALKLHAARNQPVARGLPDLSDIVALVRANQVDPRSADFRELCLTYGTEALFRKLLEATDYDG